ncbi:MAG: DNA recombination protein RmuC [Vicinamibacterales bacterium]
MHLELPLLSILTLVFGLAIGVVVGWLAARPAQARLRAALERDRAVHEERLKTYQTAEARLRDTFQALSAEALRANHQTFLQLAESRFREVSTEATADADQRKKAIEDLLTPIAQTLAAVDLEMKDAERRRVESGAQLVERIASLDTAGRDLRNETRRLVDALKRPGGRGRWGELQLKRVVELAGMVEHCHFTEQQTLGGDEGRIRPDVIVHLPGGKTIVIDAKAPLDAYLRALDATDEQARLTLLADHARQVRTHLTQLGTKAYAAQVPGSPDFVVMFLPGEMFFSAALEQDPTLIEYGVDKHVIPASPTTLIAILRAVAYGWQQQAMEENARKISELGRSLYESLRVLGGHFETLGVKLKSSLDAYNQAVGSLEGNVLSKARKFKDLQAANGLEEIKVLEQVDRVPRLLNAPDLTGGLPFRASSVEDVDEVAAEAAEEVEHV